MHVLVMHTIVAHWKSYQAYGSSVFTELRELSVNEDF